MTSKRKDIDLLIFGGAIGIGECDESSCRTRYEINDYLDIYCNETDICGIDCFYF